MKKKIEEIISVFNLNNECIIGNYYIIMKKGTFNLLKRIEKTLIININSKYDNEIMIDLDKINNKFFNLIFGIKFLFLFFKP